MSDESNRELISGLLLHVRDGLAPVVERVLTPLVPPGRSWTILLEERDRVAGRTGRYAATDLQSMLTAMTGRFGSLGFPFSDILRGPADRLLPEEIRRVRNAWAHMGDFSDADTDRALDSGARLLALVDAPQATAVEDLLAGHRRRRYASVPVAVPEIAAVEAPIGDREVKNSFQNGVWGSLR